MGSSDIFRIKMSNVPTLLLNQLLVPSLYVRTISYIHRIYVWVDQSERINAQFLGNERYYVSCSGSR